MDNNTRRIIIIINIIGVLCLIYYAIVYLAHNTIVANPDAMLPAEEWDRAGMVLSMGLIPLIIANILGFLVTKGCRIARRMVCFIPSIICFFLVISYWLN